MARTGFWRGIRRLMTAGLRPMMTKGDPAKEAAFSQLSAGSPRFGRLERIFSAVWGVTLLTECVTRVICAFTLPVNTMVWLSTVMTISAIGAGVIIGGPISGSMRKMVLLGAGR